MRKILLYIIGNKAIRCIAIFVLSGLFFTSCGAEKPVVPTDVVVLQKGQAWQLVSVRGRATKGKPDTVLEFNTEAGTLRGRTACNRYFADIVFIRLVSNTAEGSLYTLEFSNMSPGDVQCPDGDMNAERLYISLLSKADRMLLTAYTLTLYQKGKEILKFELL